MRSAMFLGCSALLLENPRVDSSHGEGVPMSRRTLQVQSDLLAGAISKESGNELRGLKGSQTQGSPERKPHSKGPSLSC